MKAKSFFLAFFTIATMLVSMDVFSQKYVELSQKTMNKYPSLFDNIEDIQFFVSADILLEKLPGENDTVSANGTLTLVNEALLIPKMKEVEVVEMSSDKKNVQIAVDTEEDIVLILKRNKRGKYTLTDIGKGDYVLIKKGKNKSTILFSAEKLDKNIREATGVKVGE